MIDKKIEVTFIKCEGLSARPIAHTCGPLWEIPSTYANYVDIGKTSWTFLIGTTGKWIWYERNFIGLGFWSMFFCYKVTVEGLNHAL